MEYSASHWTLAVDFLSYSARHCSSYTCKWSPRPFGTRPSRAQAAWQITYTYNDTRKHSLVCRTAGKAGCSHSQGPAHLPETRTNSLNTHMHSLAVPSLFDSNSRLLSQLKHKLGHDVEVTVVVTTCWAHLLQPGPEAGRLLRPLRHGA